MPTRASKTSAYLVLLIWASSLSVQANGSSSRKQQHQQLKSSGASRRDDFSSTLSNFPTTKTSFINDTHDAQLSSAAGLGLRAKISDTNSDKIDLFSDTFYSRYEGTQNKLTLAEVALVSLASKYQFTEFLPYSVHKYDSFKDLRLSGGPQANQELCLRQLEDLKRRASAQLEQRMQSKDVNLFQLLDTFGQIPSGLTSGYVFWPGAYNKCLSLKILTLGQQQDTRFCWAMLKFKSWPTSASASGSASAASASAPSRQSMKAGVCLPKSCDSLNYKHKFQLIESLLEHQNHKYVYRDEIKLVDVYCLPDEQSPLRLWYHEPRNLTLVSLATLWLGFLAYSTFKSETQRRVWAKRVAESNNEKLANSIHDSLSILHNLRRLFDCAGGSSNRKRDVTAGQDLVTFKVLPGLRVLSTWSIIMAHTLMCIPTIIWNEQDAADMISALPFLIANLLPAFTVNSFFAITGLLTSYYVLKHNEQHPQQSLITNPLNWLALICRRYLRIMPTYALFVAYLKYLAKFSGSGPFWDYATAAMAQRRKCEQEPWLLTLLLGANFKPPLEQCIPSAWYLANDFQFFLLTPILLVVLHKSPKFGQTLLMFAIGLGYATGIAGILMENTGDLSPVAKFTPHGFKTYVANLSASYTQPHHRVSAYLCALLAGHILYMWEQNNYRPKASPHPSEPNNKSPTTNGEVYDRSQLELVERPADWSSNFKKYGAALSVFFVSAVILFTPIVARLLPLEGFAAKVAVAITMPTYHLLYSMAICTYVLLASTGAGYEALNEFLASKFWKPFARLSLCVLLVNIEVISYLNQSSTHDQTFSSVELAKAQLIGLICSYFVAMVMFVTIEAPIKELINLSLDRLSSTLSVSNKRKRS